MIPFILLIALLASGPVHALQTFRLQEHDRITAQVAIGELNRVKVVNDRVAQVFGNSGAFSIETEEETGQVFVRPTRGVKGKAIALTLVTESGQTIDLLLLPQKVPPETIILKGKVQSNAKAERLGKGRPYEASIKSLIQAMYQGRPLSGFDVTYFEKPQTLWSDLALIGIGEFSGKKLLGQIYTLKNTGKTEKVICEKDFFLSEDIKAISVMKRTLSPGERTKLFMVRHHD